MKLELEQILKEPNESFKLRMFDGEPGCMDDYWHVHPEYEIVYVHNGFGRRHIGTHISSYSNGVLLFLGPNIPHLPLSNQSSPDNFEVVVQFTEDFIGEKIGAFPEFKKVMALKQRSMVGLSFGDDTKSKIESYIKPDRAFSSIDKLMWLMKLLKDLSEAEDVEELNAYGVYTEKAQLDYHRIKLIFKRVSDRYDQDFSLDDLADELGLTKNSLCRFFKKATGKTIIDYLNEFRLGMAKEYLSTDGMNVSEVLYKCGFNDPSFFYKKFKQVIGVSPREYRNQLINLNHHRQRSGHIHLHSQS